MTLSDLGVCVSSSSSTKRSNTTSPSIQPVHSQEQNDVRGGVPPPPMERCASNNSSTFSYNQDICRICHCEGDAETPLIAPCYCAGSLRYVHQSCLQQWIKSSDTKSCELCKFNFIMHSKIKPFNKWEGLDMSGMERRKIACSVTFHIVAITCVIWSLYVLIERTTEEVQEGSLEWPFWTKLIVVAIGFTGGLVFMYVQCKMYAQLVKRWRDFNRVIYVQNAPEKVPLSERDRAELQREVVVVMMAGTQQQQQQQGTGNKETCSEATHVEPDKSLMGVLSGIRRHSTTITASHHQQQQRTTTPVVHDEGKCNHGSMEELSSQALVVQSSEKMCQQPFSKSICSHSCMCLEKKSHALAQPFTTTTTTTTTGSHSCMCLEEKKRRKSVVEERDLSSQNPAQPFSKSTISSHSCLCLDKNKSVVERGSGSGGCYSVVGDQEPSSYFLDNYGPVSRDIAHSTTTYTNSGNTSSSKRGGDFLDNYGPASRDTAHSATNSSSKRGGGDEALRGGGGVVVVEPSCRMIHTPSLSLQCRTEGVVEAHEVETLHLDENM